MLVILAGIRNYFSLYFVKYCDMKPESRNIEVRIDVLC
jgi:hypothetical protein